MPKDYNPKIDTVGFGPDGAVYIERQRDGDEQNQSNTSSIVVKGDMANMPPEVKKLFQHLMSD